MKLFGSLIILALVGTPLFGEETEAPLLPEDTESVSVPVIPKKENKAPTEAKAREKASTAVSQLRKNLQPQKTGDKWLDGILQEWSDYSFESVDWVIQQFKPKANKK